MLYCAYKVPLFGFSMSDMCSCNIVLQDPLRSQACPRKAAMATSENGRLDDVKIKPVAEVYLENIRLREKRDGVSASRENPTEEISISDGLRLIIRDNKDIKSSIKREKKAKKKLCVCIAVVTAVQLLILLVLGGLYAAYTIVSQINRQPAVLPSAQGPMSAALMQPLPVSQMKAPGSDLPLPLQKYYFNVGMRNDYGLQECQGPQFKQSFPDMDYALLGYNILKGYPLEIGHDPGFTLPIFSADYSAGYMTADCRYSVPQGIILIPDVSCITSFSSDVVQTSYELSKSLSVSAHVSGGGWGVSFSASAGYKQASSQVSTGESVFIISKAGCNYYYMKMLKRKAPPFHPVFLDWILELNNTDHDDVFLDFLENYGTHFPVEMKFGASFTYEHTMTTKSYKEEQSSGVNVGISASYSGLFNVGGGFNMDSDQKQAASDFQKKVSTRTITVGAPPPADGDAMTWASTVKESPVPVTYELVSMEELFTETFMENGYMEPHAINYRRIKTKLGALKQKYCMRLKEQGLVDDCAELSPGLLMKKSRLFNHFATSKTSTTGQCIDECFKSVSCVAMTFCETCSDSVCYMYKETMPFYAKNENGWTSMFILPEIENRLLLANTDINSINKRTLKNATSVITMADCEFSCLLDIYCVAFTFCTCPDQKEKCTLYSEKDMWLVYKFGMTTGFISPSKQGKVITAADDSTTAPTVSANETSSVN